MATWQHLKRRLERPLDTGLLGTYTLVRPRRDNGRGWPPAGSAHSTIAFAHRPPGEWRLDIDGHRTLLDESIASPPTEDPAGLWFASGDYPWRFHGSPLRLVRPFDAGTLADAEPLAEPESTAHDGRPGWSVTFDLDLPAPLHLVVDADAGIVLLAECVSTGYREHLTDLEFPSTVSDRMFNPPKENATEDRYRRLLEQYRSRPLPLPGAWPEPITAPIIADGDPDTGFLVVNLGGTRTGPGPTSAWLIRQPTTDTPYDAGPAHDPDAYVHRWHSRRWQWTLVVQPRPLTPDELHNVIDTTPET